MRTPTALMAIGLALAAGYVAATTTLSVEAQAPGFGAVAAEKGGLDITGPYDVVAGWPKPMSALPGHANWTWGSVQGVFAESPNRVFMVQRGELPAIQRPAARAVPEIGPGLSFPVGQAPFRNASHAIANASTPCRSVSAALRTVC